MEEKILLIGKLIQEGIEGEAEALKDYNRELDYGRLAVTILSGKH